MCGVAGAFAYAAWAPVLDRRELRRMRDHMATRGPDGEGEWFAPDSRAGLGHRRLAIIDLTDRAAQPMASSDGQHVISFNGEIYNHRELRAELERSGHVFRTGSDTEVLLRLYAAHGTAMFDKLRGMYAFALWDARKQAMLIARDPLGIKPLYYATGGGTLRVASQVKALLKTPVDTSPDPAGHAGFLLWGSVAGPWTLYKGIKSLPAGHFMWTDARGASAPQAHASLGGLLAQAQLNPAQGDAGEALRHVSDAIHDSVRAHLVADVPVGIFLSAGLDSALLASVVRAHGHRLTTLTLGFSEYADTPSDEAPDAEALARHLGTDHHTVYVRKDEFLAHREQLLDAMDQPSIDGVNAWFVARAAARRGIKVALSGLGGDELFASYPSFRDIPRVTRAATPLARIPGLGLAVRKLTEPLVRSFTSPKYAGLLEYGGSIGGAYLLRRGLHMPWELPHLMDPDMAREGWRALNTVARLDDEVQALADGRSQRLAITALEMSWYMRHQLLADADWAGMAHSVEVRTPLVDFELARRCAPWFAAHPQLTRAQVVRAAAPELPERILSREKTGFSVPVREWLGGPSPGSRGLREWSRHIHARPEHRPRAVPGSMKKPRALISSIAPGAGGVSAMVRFTADVLRRHGVEPVLAHHATYSVRPELSVPLFRLGQRRTGHESGQAFDGLEAHAIGAWLPELEFTHYKATRAWRELMGTCEAHLMVSGNVLGATPFLETGRPYLAWVATDWEGDRRDRVKHFPAPRRMLDRFVNGPVIRRLERRLLRGGTVLALSRYTARVLDERAGRPLEARILPVPIDTSEFTPKEGATVRYRIGFAGRHNDPRKNIDLLLSAAAHLRSQGLDVTVMLLGDNPTAARIRRLREIGLENHVTFMPSLSRPQMRDCLQTLDVFALPSHQEGLCIAALEAMACGVPVVSTRCGGPQEFVLPGVTGELVGFDPAGMAAGIRNVLVDRGVRERMSKAARELVEVQYSVALAERTLWKEIVNTFPHLVGPRAAADPLPSSPLESHVCIQH